ncbi:MAG: accessory factor UbiK family protein [Deltaproteobacteria bacterium]|nr:accessory factor UbiK family protein [Deltaproteobacteria bacterium]
MEDFVDRAINIGLGLEKKIKELMEELEKKGGSSGEGEGELPPGKRLENRVVEDSVKAIRELLSALKGGKERLKGGMEDAAQRLSGKLNLATKEELDIVKEMARLAREKVDKLEKRLKELEEKTNR